MFNYLRSIHRAQYQVILFRLAGTSMIQNIFALSIWDTVGLFIALTMWSFRVEQRFKYAAHPDS